MDRNRAVELIKSFVLGCLNTESESGLKTFMEDTDNFPWEELGQYQNLAAMIPLNLAIENPGADVKDTVARKLYELKEEAESKLRTEEEVKEETNINELEDLKDDFTVEPEVYEEVLIEEDLPVEENNFPEVLEEISEKIETPASEIPLVGEQEVQVVKETVERTATKPVEEHRKGSKMREILEREEFEKRTKEYINTYYQKKFEDIREESKKTFFIAIGSIVLALIAIILSIII